MEFAVEVERLSRQFGEFRALDNVTLSIRQGEFFSLLGPSGCGKTTLLRLIAGLDLPDSGLIRIGGVDAKKISAHRRPVNTVFQSYALFPHLNVRDNVAFGLRMKRVAKEEIAWRVDRMLEMVRIIDYADRKPAQLSGGQKQRVALARALVNEPQVLLLDEPLGALDLKLRKELQVELLALQRRLGITFIFVTHDQEEALVMSDRIAVMRAGKIEQMGDSETLYERPATRFAGQFLGSCNLLEGPIGAAMPGQLLVETIHGPIRVDLGADSAPGPLRSVRDPVTVAIRPEKVQIHPPGEGPGENRVAATVQEVIYVGSMTQYLLAPLARPDRAAGLLPDAPPDAPLSAWVLNSRPGAAGFEIGATVAAVFPPASLVVLED